MPGKLTKEEFETMKEHTLIDDSMLDKLEHYKDEKMILNGECGAFNPLLMEVLVEIQDKIKEEIRYEA